MVLLGLSAGGCELIGNIGDLKLTGDGGESDSTADGPPVDTEASVPDSASGAPTDATRERAATPDVVEAAMMPPDGPSTLPETGPVEASAVPDSCVPMPEDCTNGIDDNCNGLIDCADPACTGMGYQCAPAFPAGWGPVALYDSFTANGPTPSTPQCSTGDPAYANLVAIGYYTPVLTTPTCACSGCGSINLSGATCSDPVLTTASSGCPGVPGSTCGSGNVGVATIGTTCTDYTACQNGINGVNIATNSTYVAGAACGTPSTTGSVPSWNSTTGWAGAGRVCGPTKTPSTLTGLAAGCQQAGDHCLKIPMNGLVCISGPTQQSCPAGTFYTVPHTYNSTGTDNRACDFTSCACSPYTQSITCSETVSVYNGSGCSGTAAATLTNPGPDGGPATCYQGTPINLTTAESAQATLTAKGGHCSLGGAAGVSGGITPGGTQTTVCCVP
jgi:hypothetical protein